MLLLCMCVCVCVRESLKRQKDKRECGVIDGIRCVRLGVAVLIHQNAYGIMQDYYITNIDIS